MSDNELTKIASEVRNNAYAPYSGFKVGAAVRTKGGRVFPGTNVENASFGVTICAERAAVASAIAAGEKDFVSITIVTDSPEPAVPCGACRQILAEFSPSIEILSVTTGGKQQHFTLTELLPLANQGLTRKNV